MWFTKLMRQFFFWIDKIVYNFIPRIYDFLLEIARTSILTQSDIVDMAERIYKLLAIFMVFKVTLSLVTYVVNPDDFSDKTKGIAKLGTNIIISLSLLILTPYIFNYAYRLQTIVLEDNSLAVLIFGDDLGEKNFLNSAGDEMAYITMQAFFSPNLSINGMHECTILYESVYENGKPTGKKKMNSECYEALNALKKDNFEQQTLDNYRAGIESSNFGLMFREKLAVAYVDEDFVMDYKFIFSTAVGIVIVLLLITFCMDVALRSLKLAFFQLIAPIPILSYVDPKSGKDGLFKKWYEMCFSTFISLFVRLLALYFAVYVISKVGNMQLVDIIDGSYKGDFLLYVFVVIGALMFAKQMPEILKGLGIKLDGDGKFTLNPLRKLEKEAAGGGILKKPNDALAKFGKNLALSPIKGVDTLARKTISGIDAAKNGKGFRNGWDRYKGDFGKWIDKKKEEFIPYSHDAEKKRREARENLKTKDMYHSIGSEFFGGKEKDITADDRRNAENAMLSKVSETYADSYRDVAAKKTRMHTINAEVDTAKSAILDRRLSNEDRIALCEKLGLASNATDSELIQKLDKVKGTAQKQYDEAKARHDILKQTDTISARYEDSFDYYDKMFGSVVEIPKINIQDTSGSPAAPNTSAPAAPNTGAPVTPSTSAPAAPNTSAPVTPTSSSAPVSSGSNTDSAPIAPTPTTSSTGGHDSGKVVSAEKERAKSIHEYEIEKLKKQIEEIEKELEERSETINRTISNFEKVIDSLKEQKLNPIDTASLEVINRELDKYTELVEKEKDNLRQIEEDYNSKIKYLEERIRLLTDGV